MKIKSKSDVITNSSSECFCLRIDQDFEDMLGWLKKKGFTDTFAVFRTLDDVRAFVTRPEYYCWEDEFESESSQGKDYVGPVFDIYGHWCFKDEIYKALVEAGWTDDQIWDKFKDFYAPVVGHAYAELNNNTSEGSIDELEAVNEFRGKIYQRERDKFMQQFKPGDIMVGKFDEDTAKCYNYPYVTYYIGENGQIPLSYCRDWIWLDEQNNGKGVSDHKCGVSFDDQFHVMYFYGSQDLREATEEEKKEFFEAVEKAGLQTLLVET